MGEIRIARIFNLDDDGEEIRFWTKQDDAFIARVKELGAYWDTERFCWILPSEYKDQVVEIVKDVFSDELKALGYKGEDNDIV